MEELTSTCLKIQGINNQSTPYAEEQCNILFQKFLRQYKILRQYKNDEVAPNEFIAFIRNLNNPKISPDDLKRLRENLPYSYPTLTRLFKKHMNCTITQYVNKVKLEYAKELLVSTDMTTLMITSEIHFESLGYFTRLFKKEFHITPMEYKNLHRTSFSKE